MAILVLEGEARWSGEEAKLETLLAGDGRAEAGEGKGEEEGEGEGRGCSSRAVDPMAVDLVGDGDGKGDSTPVCRPFLGVSRSASSSRPAAV